MQMPGQISDQQHSNSTSPARTLDTTGNQIQQSQQP